MNAVMMKMKMVEKDITMLSLSKELGIARSTLWRKMCSGRFTVEEVDTIISLLQLSYGEVAEIFFPNYRTNATKESI